MVVRICEHYWQNVHDTSTYPDLWMMSVSGVLSWICYGNDLAVRLTWLRCWPVPELAHSSEAVVMTIGLVVCWTQLLLGPEEKMTQLLHGLCRLILPVHPVKHWTGPPRHFVLH